MGAYFTRAREMYESVRWSPYVFFQGAGYPALLGALRRLWAHDADLGIVTGWIQLAVSLVALAAMVRLTRGLAGRRWAALALGLGAIHVPWIYFNSIYMPETLYTAVLAGLGFALLRLAREREARWSSALLVGVAGAAGAWLKSLHLFVGPIAAVVWLYPLRRGWRGAARIAVGWFAALALFFWMPHGALSQARTGRFLASPPAGGMDFAMGKCPWKELGDNQGVWYWPPLYVQLGQRNTRSWPASFIDQRFFLERGLECIAARPRVLLESLAGIPYLFVGNRLWPAMGSEPRCARLSALWERWFSWPLAALVALGLGLAVVRGARARGARPPGRRLAGVWLVLVVPLLSLFATVWLMFSELRYRIPFDVFTFPLALWALRESWRWGRALRSRPRGRPRRAPPPPTSATA
jgi:hypothetical protein